MPAIDVTLTAMNGDGSLQGTIKWVDLKDAKKDIFRRISSLLSSSKPENQLFLAILAAELWHAEGENGRQSKDARDFVRMTDAAGTYSTELSNYFESP